MMSVGFEPLLPLFSLVSSVFQEVVPSAGIECIELYVTNFIPLVVPISTTVSGVVGYNESLNSTRVVCVNNSWTLHYRSSATTRTTVVHKCVKRCREWDIKTRRNK